MFVLKVEQCAGRYPDHKQFERSYGRPTPKQPYYKAPTESRGAHLLAEVISFVDRPRTARAVGELRVQVLPGVSIQASKSGHPIKNQLCLSIMGLCLDLWRCRRRRCPGFPRRGQSLRIPAKRSDPGHVNTG